MTAPPMQPRSVLLIDPHDFTRDGLAAALEDVDGGLSVVGRPVAEAVPGLNPDLALVRVDEDGGEAAVAAFDRARTGLPDVRVAVLPPSFDLDAAVAAIRAGAVGCLSPALGVRHLARAIRVMIEGGLCIGPVTAAPDGDNAAGEGAAGAGPAHALTAREAEVLALLEQGRPNKVIAYELGLSENTVKVHVGRILRKLNAANRTAVACLHPPKG